MATISPRQNARKHAALRARQLVERFHDIGMHNTNRDLDELHGAIHGLAVFVEYIVTDLITDDGGS